MPILNLQPTLQGQLLELCPLRQDDFESLFAAASDPLIWEQHPESDRYTPEAFQRYFDGALKSGGALAILDRKSGKIIGSSRYADYRPADSEVEIGWTFIERAYWGGDYNRELKKLMLDHAFTAVDRVLFRIGEHNIRSRKSVEKLGARYLRSEPRLTTGIPGTNVVYAINKTDFP